MKRLITGACLSLIGSQLLAQPIYHPPGPNLTYGAVSNSQTIMSTITNPAAAAAGADKNGSGVSFGILSNVGVGYEIGEVDDMYDRLDQVIDDFDNNFNDVTDLTDASLVDAQISNANDLLDDIREDGYGKVFASVHIPVMPVVLSSSWLGGSWVFDASVTAVAKVSAFSDPLAFDVTGAQAFIDGIVPLTPSSFDAGDVVVNFDGTDFSYDIDGNDSSMVARAAGIVEAAVGYSTELTNFMGGKVFGGVRGKYYKVTLLQDVEKFDDGDDSDDAEDYLDDLDLDDGEETTGVGIDVGVLWVSDHLRLGGTITNINEPEFDYNDFDLTGFTDPNIISQLGELDGATYTMEAQATVEAAVHSKNQRWVLSAAMDLNEVEDPIGDEYQWATISAAYATESWWLPGLRAGYRVNQAGTEISYLTGGLTMFNVNLDVAYSPDKVEDDDGDEVSRSIMFNLGLELTF